MIRLGLPFHSKLSATQQNLLDLTLNAHSRSATNLKVASTAAVINSFRGNGGNLQMALASGLLTLGGAHGPTTQARKVFGLSDYQSIVDWLADRGKIPGFGNSFHWGAPDPTWDIVSEYLTTTFPHQAKHRDELTEWVQRATKKPLHPNAALYTAITATACGFRPGTELAIFIYGRLGTWIDYATRPAGAEYPA